MNETIKEMMSAYVTGCMDNRNLLQFVEYIQKGGEIPNKEFGELQNVASLIPLILEIETPPVTLQNKIFQNIPDEPVEIEHFEKKSKRTQLSEIIAEKIIAEENESNNEDEIIIPEDFSFTRTQKKEEKKHAPIHEEVIEENGEDIDKEIANIFAPKKEQPIKHKQVLHNPEEKHPHVKIVKKEAGKSRLVIPEEIDKPAEVKKSVYEIPIVLPDKLNFIKDLLEKMNYKIWIFAAFILLLIVVFVWNINSSEEDLVAQNEKLLSEVYQKDNFIRSNLPLIESFNQKDTRIVDLASTQKEEDQNARIIVSPSTRKAILQFIEIPKISAQKILQFWIISKGQSFSIGIIQPVNNQKFYNLSEIPSIPFEEIELFRVTIEPKSGSEYPTGKTIYFGAF